MKKILSFLVILSMVCSFLCVPSFAENTGGIRFNFADGEMAHTYTVIDNGKYVYQETTASSGDKTENAEITGGVTLTKSGYYDLTYLIGYKTGGASSASVVTLTVGEYEFINDASYTEDAQGYKVTDLYPMKKYEKKLYWFDAGTVDIKFSAAPTSAARWRFQAAYIEFVPAKIDSLRFNFADYTSSGIYTNATNEQSYLYAETPVDSSPEDGITVTGTIKLPKGYYDVTYLMGYRNGINNASVVDLTIGEYAYQNTEKANGNTALEGYWSTTYFPMSEYNKNMLWFDGGDVTITLHVNPTSYNGRCRYQAAYVEFKPVKTIHLDFADGQMAHQYEVINNGSYVYQETTASSGDKTENAEITMSVNIAEAGYYDLTYLIGYKTGGASSASVVTLTVGEYEFINDASYTEDAQGYKVTDLYPMKKYEKKLYWFDAGTVDIKFSAAPTSAARWRFQAGHIEITRADVNTLCYDFVDYATSGSEGAQGQFKIEEGPKTEPLCFTIPVNIPDTATYNVTYLIGQKTKSSPITLALKPVGGGETIEIGNNTESGTDVSANWTFYEGYAPMHQYEKEIFITQGKYELEVEIGLYNSVRWLTQLAYIEFSTGDGEQSNENSLTEEDGTVTATVYYDSAVSGTPILALYSGNKLVDVNIGDTITDATDCVTIHVASSKEYDKAKVFVWNGEDTMQTEIGEVILTK